MKNSNENRTESVAAIAKHPLHPFLVAFPIAFLIGAFGCDLVFWRTGDPFWTRASFWLIAAGLATGVVAAATGFIDFISIKRARSLTSAWVHFIGNDLALLLTAGNLWSRFSDHSANVIPGGVITSGAVVAIFAVTGWLGGELAFRHHVGMIRTTNTAGQFTARS
jgi:uncharacterized membrane protein